MPKTFSDTQPNVFGYEGSSGFSSKFWELVLLTGVGAGLGGGALMALLRAAQHLAWSYKSGDFVTAVSNSSTARRISVLLIAGVIVAVARRVLRRPTGGHGGEVAAAIWFRSGEMPFWRTAGSAVVSIVAVALGAAVGRESAPKQVGAAISNLLARWAKIPSSQRRLLVACGAGAGMAAVYNIPFGGAIFALEVLLGQLSLPLVLPALATSLIAVAVSWLFLPNQPTYFFPVYAFSAMALAGAVLLGLVAGLASIFCVRAIVWADERKPKGKWLIITPICVFAVLGVASLNYPQLLGNGKDVVQSIFVDQFGLPLLAVLLVLRTLATISCLAAGTPGGLFTPTLAIGALLGGFFGHLWNQILPGEATGAYAIFGAGAVLAGTTKGPLSAAVLIFELTNHVAELAVPLILAIVLATWVARQFDPRSIYSARIHSGKLAATHMNHARVISAATRYPEIIKGLLPLAARNAPLYVLDEDGVLIGQISVDRASQAESFAYPLETASADDLATPAKTLPSSLSADEMERRLEAEHLTEAPVIEADSGLFLGIFDSSTFSTERQTAAQPNPR